MVRGKPQRIRDPIHDLIEFDGSTFEQVCWEAIQTPPFQRLRRIKQLGFSDLVYPGATHSRFAHSVGVFHTARQLTGVLERKLDREIITARANIAKVAALLHDVGHGPFSHSFESALKQLDIKRDHEEWTAQIIRETEICDILSKLDDSSFADRVAKMILHEGPQDIYSSIVSSQFDADRLDYMRRDRMMAGTQHAAIDFSWLLANLDVRDVPVGLEDTKLADIPTFVLGPKAVYAAEAYVLGLFQLYPTVYFHKTTRGAEKLFSELIFRLGTLVKDDKVEITGLPEKHPLVVFFQNPNSLDAYLALDDSVVWGALQLLVHSKDLILNDVAKRILDRNFYKVIEIFDLAQEADISAKLNESGLLDRNNILPVVMEDRAKRDPYKKRKDGTTGGINQIYGIDSGNKVKDLNELSDVVKSLQPHNHYRIYVRDDEIAQIVNKIIKSVGGRNAH